MIHDILNQIETRLQQSGTLSSENREALEKLLEELRQEIDAMDDAQAEKAESIAGFTAASAREALRKEKDEDLMQFAIEGLQRSVRDFEASHPKLTHVVNGICHQLSNLGI